MGHAAEEIGDIYSKLKDDEVYPGEWAERIGLGFSIGTFGPLTSYLYVKWNSFGLNPVTAREVLPLME
jgi:hypothetical protein